MADNQIDPILTLSHEVRDGALQRLLARCTEQEPPPGVAGPCWVVDGGLTVYGYSQVRCADKVLRGHRLTYFVLIGVVPVGLVLDHLCRNRACCNPWHMEAIGQRVNSQRGLRGDLKATCDNGHPRTPENRAPNGKSDYGHPRFTCLICRRERGARQRKKLQLARTQSEDATVTTLPARTREEIAA